MSSVLPAAANNGGRYAGMAWKGKVYLFRDHLATKSDIGVTRNHDAKTVSDVFGSTNTWGRFAWFAYKGKINLFRDELSTSSDVVLALWHERLR